jgi:hypothetical protein
VSALKIPVWGKTFLQKLVCKDSCLWQSPHGMPHFDINVSIVYLVGKVELVYDSWQESQKFDPHVFKPVKGGRKVKILMSRHMNLALGVLSTLFQCNFAVVMSAVLLVRSPG